MSTPQELARLAQSQGFNETDQKAALQEYLSNGGVNLDPAVTAWCAAFVNSTLAQSGQTGTGSNMARSFMDWGQGVDDPQKGDLAVFSRGDPNGPFGHVGFFQGYDDDGNILVLGGNQGDAVNVSAYDANNLLGFRRGATPEPTAKEGHTQPENALAGYADKLKRYNALMSLMPRHQEQSAEPFMNRLLG